MWVVYKVETLSRCRLIYNWVRNVARGQTPSQLASGGRRDGRSPSEQDRDASVIERIDADLRADIVRGRAALANASRRSYAIDGHELARRANDRSVREGRDNAAIARLLELLWHENEDARRAAAHALPGGDHQRGHVPHYGHFVGAFLRGLSEEREGQMPPVTAAERFARVSDTLRAMLAQSVGEIRGMSNMNYSFLSSALYLAVLATCRDTLLAMERLRPPEAQAELCGLLWNLAQINVLRRLNAQDLETLATLAGQALSALPPDQTPDFWHGLTHASLPRRLAVAPGLLHCANPAAVPYLLDALDVRHAQPADMVISIVECLARLEDTRALPTLQTMTPSHDRQIRASVHSAIANIQRAGRGQPCRTLLRAVRAPSGNDDSETMLRSAPVNHHNTEPPRELLRPPCSTE